MIDDEIEDRALNEVEAVLAYFKNLEALGDFAGVAVDDNKRSFLMMSFVNFARRERLLHSSGVTLPAADGDEQVTTATSGQEDK